MARDAIPAISIVYSDNLKHSSNKSQSFGLALSLPDQFNLKVTDISPLSGIGI